MINYSIIFSLIQAFARFENKIRYEFLVARAAYVIIKGSSVGWAGYAAHWAILSSKKVQRKIAYMPFAAF